MKQNRGKNQTGEMRIDIQQKRDNRICKVAGSFVHGFDRENNSFE